MTKSRILKSNPYKNTTLSSIVIHALASGKGITWLDRVRIPYKSDQDKNSMDIRHYQQEDCFQNKEPKKSKFQVKPPNKGGRFPANLLCSDDILNDGIERKTGDLTGQLHGDKKIYGDYIPKPNYHKGDSGSYSRYFDLDKWWEKVISDE